VTNSLGRAFVAAYYTVSPPIAVFIERHETLRFAARLMLTPVVYGIQYPIILLIGFMITIGGTAYGRRRLLSPHHQGQEEAEDI
jgi:hypothetical protein